MHDHICKPLVVRGVQDPDLSTRVRQHSAYVE